MNNDDYKEVKKILNLITIMVCWMINLVCMFVYPALAILIANIFAIIIVNLVVFIVWKEMN